MPGRLLTLLTLFAVLAGATACGNGDDTDAGSKADVERPNMAEQSPETLPASDLERVKTAEESIAAHCGLGEPGEQPEMSLPEAIRTLANVYRLYPEATYAKPEDDQPRSMEKVVQDNLATLRKCGERAVAARLERVLEG